MSPLGFLPLISLSMGPIFPIFSTTVIGISLISDFVIEGSQSLFSFVI